MARRESSGFTLIELLVTIAIFTAVMGALVTSMRAGIRSWKNIRDHQIREAEIQHAIDVVTNDMMHLFIPEQGAQPLAESPLEDKGDKVTVSALELADLQRAGRGNVWNQITYFVRSNKQEGSDLVRESVSFIAKTPLNPEPIQAVLLSNIKKLTVDYGAESEFVPEWNQTKCPPEIMVTLEQESGRAISWAICIPAGMWSQK